MFKVLVPNICFAHCAVLFPTKIPQTFYITVTFYILHMYIYITFYITVTIHTKVCPL